MLDDAHLLRQRDPSGLLDTVATEYQQTTLAVEIKNGDNDGRLITSVVVDAEGEVAHAARLLQVWLGDTLRVPFEVMQGYTLPTYVGRQSLVVAATYSDSVGETVENLRQAQGKGAQLAVITKSGQLLEMAQMFDISYVKFPTSLRVGTSMIYALRALARMLVNFGIITDDSVREIDSLSGWLKEQSANWLPSVMTDKNYAKQLSLQAIGKTSVFYGGELTAALAYKWKTDWNKKAKNVAFWNRYPEVSHDDFSGWMSHPIEKPFAIFDIVSHFEDPRILELFRLSDRFLSGLRPRAIRVNLVGDSLLRQLLWGCVLSDFTSIYVAVLNQVDPATLKSGAALSQKTA